ncbi:AraC family transcriptional regulator, partial [Staphylococcus hominis]|nr:AraC family transcriptional regulator [Staphylococcus hominis]
LQSSHFIKSIILNNIEHMYNTSHHDDKVIPKIIQTFYKEAVIRHPHIYIPKIPVEQHILINILTFIHDHITSNISLQDIAAHVLISESYCSNLFVRILNINFKDYYTSLKINHAIRLLICTNDSITSISE